MRRAGFLVVIMSAALFAACALGTEPSGCDVCTTSAIVYGTVRSHTAAPVAGVRITIEARAPSCQAGGIGGNQIPILTDTLGNYRAVTLSPSAPRAVCLIVAAQPPDSSAARRVADTGHVVRLEADYPADQVHDSVRVDLVLPAP